MSTSRSIDSGVAPLPQFDGRIVNGPDLSFGSGDAAPGVDQFGHGTHMAGIIAGRDPSVGLDPKSLEQGSKRSFVGIAPGARLLNMKVAAPDGAVDVSQVIAAIDWVVQHRNTDGLNVRVLNLSFGTDGIQDYQVDPLTFAVENAWRQGIVVVVSAGNAGYGSPMLNNPAYDPYVIAIGASDTNGTVGPRRRLHRRLLQPRRSEPAARHRRARPVDRQPACAGLAHRRGIPRRTRRRLALPRQRHLPGRGGDVRRGRAPAAGVPEPDARPGQGRARQQRSQAADPQG